MKSRRIAILGAGSVGAYLGGCLAGSRQPGLQVRMIGRPRLLDVFRQQGLHLTSLAGQDLRLAHNALDLSTEEAALAGADLVLVCVKAGAIDEAAAAIARQLPTTVPVVSLQNGLAPSQRLRERLPGRTVLAGMVPFNVVHLGQGHLHRGTAGELALERDAALEPWRSVFERAGLPLRLREDIANVQAGKLLLNLNNAINALSDQPLKRQLSTRGYRRVLAAAIAEALSALRAEGIEPSSEAAVPPRWLPLLLRLPDALYTRLARRSLAMDERARSSMADDLRQGRRTEVDSLNGAIVSMAARQGRSAPVNAALVALVHEAEAFGGPSGIGPDELLHRCGLA